MTDKYPLVLALDCSGIDDKALEANDFQYLPSGATFNWATGTPTVTSGALGAPSTSEVRFYIFNLPAIAANYCRQHRIVYKSTAAGSDNTFEMFTNLEGLGTNNVFLGVQGKNGNDWCFRGYRVGGAYTNEGGATLGSSGNSYIGQLLTEEKGDNIHRIGRSFDGDSSPFGAWNQQPFRYGTASRPNKSLTGVGLRWNNMEGTEYATNFRVLSWTIIDVRMDDVHP